MGNKGSMWGHGCWCVLFIGTIQVWFIIYVPENQLDTSCQGSDVWLNMIEPYKNDYIISYIPIIFSNIANLDWSGKCTTHRTLEYKKLIRLTKKIIRLGATQLRSAAYTGQSVSHIIIGLFTLLLTCMFYVPISGWHSPRERSQIVNPLGTEEESQLPPGCNIT